MPKSVGSMLTFAENDGYLEALLRGYKCGILVTADYNNLVQCDNLEDLKLHLSGTSYGDFLANEPSPLHTTTIAEKCTEILVKQFKHMRSQAVQPLAKFLDYITYGYMIDNIILLITGTLHERDISDLIGKCHPLGVFESMPVLSAARTVHELYNSVIIDTPLAPYFQECLSKEDLDEMTSSMELEIIRNTLYKAYLEDFYKFCRDELQGVTAEVMCELLEWEADRRSINITINSFGTELSKDDREKLYPRIGLLRGEGIKKLSKSDDNESVRASVEHLEQYSKLFDEIGFNGDKTLEDAFFEYEVKLNILSFEKMFHYGAFYSYVKLKEQEIRNIVWIAECIAQKQQAKINNFIPIFQF